MDAELLVPKGSIAVDGVSLTLVDVAADGFSVMLIPHTLAATTLGRLRPGDRVNIEADMLAKHVRKLLAAPINDAPDRARPSRTSASSSPGTGSRRGTASGRISSST